MTHESAMRRLNSLDNIIIAARWAMLHDDTQQQWYKTVYQRLKDQEFLPYTSVKSLNLAGASISPAFYPRTYEDNTLPNSATMDYALAYRPWELSPWARQREMDEIIDRCLNATPQDQRHINATNESQKETIAIHIAATFSEAPDEGRARLGVWAAAWFRRMGILLRSRESGSGDEVPEMTTLPLIHVVEHDWKLLFTCDRGDHIRVLHSISTGDTNSLLGIHTLVAVLDELANWIDNSFEVWIHDDLSAML